MCLFYSWKGCYIGWFLFLFCEEDHDEYETSLAPDPEEILFGSTWLGQDFFPPPSSWRCACFFFFKIRILQSWSPTANDSFPLLARLCAHVSEGGEPELTSAPGQRKEKKARGWRRIIYPVPGHIFHWFRVLSAEQFWWWRYHKCAWGGLNIRALLKLYKTRVWQESVNLQMSLWAGPRGTSAAAVCARRDLDDINFH